MKNLICFLEDNPDIIKGDDWSSLSEQMRDALFCKNLNHYCREWLKAEGVNLIRDFHNSKSDVNPMEESIQEVYFVNFQKYLNTF